MKNDMPEQMLKISIHAPPRGATGRSCESKTSARRFQFTPLREGRHAPCDALDAASEFQFTPLREGRHGRTGRRTIQPGDFNSRPSARGDPRDY